MADRVKWGILSTAHINRRLIPEIKSSPDAELVAVASRNARKGQDYAGRWEIPVAYSGYQDLVDDPQIDVVYISLPNHLHTEWTIKSLEAGKHVLCEKPLCLTITELDQLQEAQARTGKYVSEAFMYLHHPRTELFRSVVTSGQIGRLESMMSTFCFTFERGEDNYRLSESEGGGALWDVGVYPISLFDHLTGEAPIGCYAKWQTNGIVDTSCWATLHYPGGTTGQFFVSFETAFTTQTTVIGSSGTLQITHPFNNPEGCEASLEKGGSVESLAMSRDPLYAGEVADMNQVSSTGRPPAVGLDQSRRYLQTVLALRASAISGKPMVIQAS